MANQRRPTEALPSESSEVNRNMAQVALGTGAYLSSLSGSVVNSTLPILGRALGADVATIEWVVVSFLLIQSGMLLGFGRLGDLRGHKPIYVIGLTLFIISSALCGFSPSAGFLIGARVLQAIGGAMGIAMSAAILTHAFPAHQRGRALGTQATMVYLGLASGPPLGGWLADTLSWRAVFFVNIPFALVALLLSIRYLPRDVPAHSHERFDWAGATTYLLGLSALMLGLNRAHAWGWTSPFLLACLGFGAAMLGLFAVIELRTPSPMLDLDLFRRRAFSAPVLSAVLNYLGVASTFFLMPFYLIQARGMPLAQAGLILMAQPIVMAVTASFSGALSDRVGSRLPATLGMVVLAGGLFALSRAGETTPLAYVAGALAIIGLGIGLFTSPNSSAVMGAVPRDRRGVASGILSTARTLGNVLGVGIASAIFNGIIFGEGRGEALVAEAVSAGLTLAAGVALLGAITSATRPSQDSSH